MIIRISFVLLTFVCLAIWQDLARLKEAVRDLNVQQLQKKKKAEEEKTATDELMQPPN